MKDNPAVHILATCRTRDLWSATVLFLKTIRIGFPTFQIFVEGNNLEEDRFWELQESCIKIGAVSKNNTYQSHPDWIAALIQDEVKPFIICDTDMIFFNDVEKHFYGSDGEALMGQFIPRFRCPFTGTITEERLHTALMLIDPEKIKKTLSELNDRLNRDNPFWVGIDLVRPANYALNGEVRFHDSMGQAWHVAGGKEFEPALLDCYAHIGCGSYLDLLEKKIPGSRQRQEEIMSDPEKARGLWKQQQRYYESRAI